MYPKLEFIQEMHPTTTTSTLHDSSRYSSAELGHMSGVPIPASGVPDPSPIPTHAHAHAHAHAHVQRPYPPAYMISNSLPRAPSAPIPGQWTSGLCHCFDDPVNCAITWVAPCITFGQITEIVNRGSKSCCSRGLLFGLLSVMGVGCFYSCFYRSKLRAQYDLPEEPCTDCLVHFCCCSCALCQEYRELKNRGFDMGIGWEANMDRQKRGVTVAPIIVPGMARI